MKTILSLFLFCGAFPLFGQYPSGEMILKKIDKNLYSDSRITVSKMVIHGRRGSRTITAKSWVQGMDQSFTEYLSPAREKGTKMLKLHDKLWTYSPSADRTIQIAGHMLRQSVMGSDLSYEDFMEDKQLTDVYQAMVVGEEKLQNRDCWVVELTAKSADVAYHSRKIWVDKARMLPLQEQRFAKSGKLLKTFSIKEIIKIDHRWYPKVMVFKDALKRGRGTELYIESIEFDKQIPKYIFSKAALRK